MTGLLRSRLVWAATALAGLVGLYAFLGYRVAPGWLRTQAIEQVRKTYGRELQLGEVRIDPFRLELEVRDLAFPDTDGQVMIGFQRLFVDFQIASVWRRALVFRDVGLEAPKLRAVIRADGSMNLADLAPPDPGPAKAPATAAADDELPAIWIESLEVGNGRADYVDLTARRRPIAHTLAPVSFTLKDFRTTPQGGSFSLSAATEADERFAWQGRFALAPAVNSDGEFSIGGLRATAVANLLGDALPFDVSAGTIELAGRYRLSLGDTTTLELAVPQLTLAGLALRAFGVDEDWVSLPQVAVSGTQLALPAQTVAVDRIELSGAKARAWLAADGSLNLARLAAGPAPPAAGLAPPPPPGPGAASRPTRPAAPPPVPDRPWSLRLGELALRDAAVDFEDRSRPPTKTFAIAPLNVAVRDASLDLSKPLPVALDATVNGRSRLELKGNLTPEPLSTELEVALKGARLQILQPYILPLADLTVRSGTVDGRGQLRYGPPAPGRPTLSFDGSLELADFRSTDNALGQDLLAFGRFGVEKLRYTMSPDAVSIDRIRLVKPYARLVIGPEGILNLSAVLDPAGTRAEIESRRRAEAEKAQAASRKGPQRGKRAAKPPQPKGKRDKAAGKPAPAKPTAPTPEGMPIRIREVRIDGGRLNFSDLNVRPNFAADILDLQGSLRGLSSAFESRATIDLKGNLGEFSPVTIGGTIQPFAFDRHTDVALDFRNISLPVFNPYSGRFAGYTIAKGKLDTRLRYRIEDRRLKADHSLRIDQLEWGEASAERGEASLPVKFATALLRDRNGVIALDIPVGGTLDDPKLRIGPIVWQIIKNLIVKAVTAPFALLGSLFKGAEEAQFVDFAPGEATIDPAETERLAALARGLAEKAGISLDVPIGASAELDSPALAEQAYARALAATTREAAGIKDPAAAVPAFDSLPHRTRVAALQALLRARTGTVPELPEPPAPPEDTPRAEARAAAERAELEFLQGAARKAVPAEGGALEALAEARARAIERALLAGGELAPNRVFLARNGKFAPKDGKLRFELALK